MPSLRNVVWTSATASARRSSVEPITKRPQGPARTRGAGRGRPGAWSSCVALGFLVLGGAACGTATIPTVAAEGSTVTIPIPRFFVAGFGKRLNAHIRDTDPTMLLAERVTVPVDPAAPLYEDGQRGELLFVLKDSGGNFVSYLHLNRIVRVHGDERSSTGLPEESQGEANAAVWSGQTVAFVDIPTDVAPATELPADFTIEVERWIRDDSPGFRDQFVRDQLQIEGEDWVGWGSATQGGHDVGIPITIVEGTGSPRFFPKYPKGWDKSAGSLKRRDVTSDLSRLVPRPSVEFLIKDLENGEPFPYAGAMEMELQYPAERVVLMGVTANGHFRSGAMVFWNADNSAPLDCSQSEPRTARISMLDPAERTHGIGVVFRLRDFQECGRVSASDFVVTAFTAWDRNGSKRNDIGAWRHPIK